MSKIGRSAGKSQGNPTKYRLQRSPHTISMAQKRSTTTIVVLLTLLAAIGPVSTDLYLPSLPSLAETLGASVSQTQLTLSFFMGGFAVGTLFYGPLSDRIGRRPALLIGMALYTLASLACAFATSVEQLIALRFVEALGGCAGAVLSRAVVRDLFAGDHDVADQACKIAAYARNGALLLDDELNQTFAHVFSFFGFM